MTSTTFLEQARALVGVSDGLVTVARDPVNRPMIHQWCDAIGDDNPAYLDDEAAAATVHGGLVAPPAMLKTWTMAGLRGREGSPGVVTRLVALAAEAGFDSVIATNSEQEYSRYLRVGDIVSEETVIESVSDEKATSLGQGHFVTYRTIYRDQHGDDVGAITFRILLFHAPPASSAAPDAATQRPRHPRPVTNRDSAFFWEGIERGELRIQRCASCKALRHPPRPMCPTCQSLDWDFVLASGLATLYSYVVMRHPQVPPFEYPNLVALVELDEGTRLITNLVGVGPDEAEIGMRLEVRFVTVDDDLTLPLFAPAGGEEAT